MNTEDELLQRLMVSKKIMDKHNGMDRGQSRGSSIGGDYSSPMVESYEAIPATYNLPQEFLQEQQTPKIEIPKGAPSQDRILNSKLPDEIKRLMIEHPIEQPNMGAGSNSILSNELVEKASRLMNVNAKGDVLSENRPQKSQTQQSISNSITSEEIKNIVRETVEEVLYENGLLVESESNSNEVFKFRVGDRIFEGKLTKIKRVSK
jgi:hypothetical protein